MKLSCIQCKGRDPSNCGRTFCPLIVKAEAMFRVNSALQNLGDSFYGSSPAPFVGRFGYPHINVGILSPPEQTESAGQYDAPRQWAAQGLDINQIVELRSRLINSRFKAMATDARKQDKLLGISKEVGMASKPVDVEIQLEQKPKFRLSYNADLAPMGPLAELKKADITSNPKIDSRVEKVVSDTDLKANSALIYLWQHGFDENFLTKLLSVGNLGLKKNRKLVPTRWSITATDDMLAKKLMQDIKEYPQANYSAYFGNYLGNYYLVLVFPEIWSYELFETYMPNADWNTTKQLQYSIDYEGYAGRKTYAENCAGGYYSVRLAILEKLAVMKKQGSILTIRIITGDYAVPLGVWVTRETARKAMQSRPIEFASKELMLKYASALIQKKFGFDISPVLNKSIVLKNLGEQRKLGGFL